MRLILDADGLIKIHRAGVLGVVLASFPCDIPQAVYDEVVTEGKAHLHQDAEEIEAMLGQQGRVAPAEEQHPEGANLGRGETAALALAAGEPGSVVISDDRRFLSELAARDIPFLTPADLLTVMARRRILTRAEAGEALERLRPAIRTAAYWEAKEDLEGGGGDEE